MSISGSSERKKAQEALRQSDARFAKAFNSSPIGMSISSFKKGLLLDVNEAFLKMFEFNRKEVIGHTSNDLGVFTSLDQREKTIQLMRHEETISNVESTLFTKSGKTINVIMSVNKFTIDHHEYLLNEYLNTTELKKAEQELLRTEKLLSAVTDVSSDAIYVKDRDSRWLFANPALQRIAGKTSFEVLGKTDVEIYANPEAGKKILVNDKEIMDSGKSKTFEESVDLPDGRHYFISVKSPRFDEKGQVIGLIGISHDFTERKKAEEALKELNNKLESKVRERTNELASAIRELNEVLESINDAFFVLDSKWNITYLNNKVAKLWNVDKRGTLGKNFWNAFPRLKGSIVEEQLINSMENRKIGTFEIAGIYTKGSYEAKVYPSHDGLSVLLTDVTDRKNLEKALREKERLAAIGMTAGMVGHDIRNPLQAMLGDIFLIKEELASLPKFKVKEDITESLESLEQNISYVNKIVADLQDYSRTITPEYSQASFEEIIFRIFQTAFVPQSIKLSKVNRLEKIRTDPNLLQRALTNLITNAIQAMPNGGTLEITSHVKNNRVVITVSDTGGGIPDEIKPKLFTPMMTTKAKGQGFGLAVSKRLIEAMKGTITFESEKGKGTKFIIELPTKSNSQHHSIAPPPKG
jgi:PAS domain S-box-containing protein